MTKPDFFFHGDSEPAEKPYHYKECGLPNIYLANGYQLETVDGDEYVTIHNVDGLWRAIAMNLVSSQKLLPPSAIRFLRGQMDYTQAEIADLLGVDDQTVARWEKAQARLPGPADRAIRVFYLASEASGDEGKEMLKKLVEMVTDLVERDAPLEDSVVFSTHNSHWEPELATC
ncbi:helix-turn-helix domain-containing protein [Devosia sp. 2618]|uniref:helix-turn-helix domain-containing protein n=1 Tax=Devosia sp. 2618 TaxID=3156454 RepID=UPI0033975104